jgi:protein-S-isoprenylcysteine O-methyltransferase Ste14
MDAHIISIIYVVVLFTIYVGLWAVKKRSQIKATGLDPEVFGKSASPLQRYIFQLTKVITIAAIILIASHAFLPDTVWGLQPLSYLNKQWIDLTGFLVGLTGLVLCWSAQRTMADAWRVGIDETSSTELVTGGPFRFVRNPTYTGLFTLLVGLWLIWPTWAVLTFVVIFVLMLEVQVRCEEEFMLRKHGDAYSAYFNQTGRYLPKKAK